MEPEKEEAGCSLLCKCVVICIASTCFFVLLVFLVSLLLYKFTTENINPASNNTYCPSSCQLQGFEAPAASALDYSKSILDTVLDQFSDEDKVHKEICCPDIGCFNNGSPFQEFPLPLCINMSFISYTLFTKHSGHGVAVKLGENIPANYMPSHKTILITHGYQSSGNSTWIQRLKEALLTNYDGLNVIVLDWSYYAYRLFYSQSAANCRAVGAYNALVLQHLAATGTKYSDMWCIGHSLGAHICGYTGLNVPEKMGRITGLDPAGPCFECQPSVTVGLHTDCAQFVEVIHTDAAGALGEFGTKRPLGHTDFYPNGLGNQPGCMSKRKKRHILVGCSHSRAYHIFTESLHRRRSCQAHRKCKDVDNMPKSCVWCSEGECPRLGFNTSTSTEGIFYINTYGSAPYCMG